MEYLVFVSMLIAIARFHKKKTQIIIVVVGFLLQTIFFCLSKGLHEWIAHFTEDHRLMLFLNLMLLLPGFGILAHYFEHSGVAKRVGKFLQTDTQLLWLVFVLSIVLDNIAAALIGCIFLKARYGQPPFKLLIGCIGSANLGGAASFLGDTTTVMLYLSGVSPLVLAKAFTASVPAQYFLVKYCSKHDAKPLMLNRKDSTPIEMRYFAPLLGIPGLVIGNQIHDLAGLGLLTGIGVGLFFARVKLALHLIWEALPTTLFLLLLVASAESIPLEPIKNIMVGQDTMIISIVVGIVSAFFDNIPLTALCIALKDFDWSLLAYCVGFGGSLTWFGSSTGIAVSGIFREVAITKRWVQPFFVLLMVYLSGVISYLAFWYGIIPSVQIIITAILASSILLGIIIICFFSMVTIQYKLAKLGKTYFPGNRVFRSWLAEIRHDWH